MLKTKLPQTITTVEQAKKLLSDLYNNGEAYHPEDLAGDCLSNHGITDQEANQLDKLMEEIYNLKGNENSQTMLFDPCWYYLMMFDDGKF